MPDPPNANLLTRWVLENPWPVSLSVLLAALMVGWSGFRGGVRVRQQWAIVLGVLGVAVLALGMLVTTAGERAEGVARAFVEAVVAEDVVAADELLADEAALALGSPMNPGYDIDFLRDQLNEVARRYDIESNTITRMRGHTQSSSTGVVHLACLTRESNIPYPMISHWVIRVNRQPDDTWKIVHLTFVSLNDRAPAASQLR